MTGLLRSAFQYQTKIGSGKRRNSKWPHGSDRSSPNTTTSSGKTDGEGSRRAITVDPHTHMLFERTRRHPRACGDTSGCRRRCRASRLLSCPLGAGRQQWFLPPCSRARCVGAVSVNVSVWSWKREMGRSIVVLPHCSVANYYENADL